MQCRSIDNAGKTKRILQYSPFGEVYEFGKTKGIERTLRSFIGYECEDNLNLMYAQARYYMPKIGRFAEEDSNKGNGYIPESINYYMYCYNNPLCYIDPNGNEPEIPSEILTDYFIFTNLDEEKNANKETYSYVDMNEVKYRAISELKWDAATNTANITTQYVNTKDGTILPNTRKLTFKKGEYSVYESYFDGKFYRNRVYSLNEEITVEKINATDSTAKMIVKNYEAGKDDDENTKYGNVLTYILSCEKYNSEFKAVKLYYDYSSVSEEVEIDYDEDLGEYPAFNDPKLNEEITPLRFVSSGYDYIFLDNPEEIYIVENEVNPYKNLTMAYLWGSSLSTSFKDVEMYKHVHRDNLGDISFGVAIYNANAFQITIDYKKEGTHVEGYVSGNDFIEQVAECTKKFLSASTKQKTINGNSIGIIEFSEYAKQIEGSDKYYYKTIYFRGRFKSSVSSKVWLRAFIFGDNKTSNLTNSAKDLFKLEKMYGKGKRGFFTGEVNNCTEVRPISNLYTFKKYHFSDHPMENYNFNEYTMSSNCKSPGTIYIPSNYGVVYKFTISNPAGKTMKIIPDKIIGLNNKGEKDILRTHAAIVYRRNNEEWISSYTKIEYDNKDPLNNPNAMVTNPFKIDLGTGNTETVEIVIVSGNFGNFTISFE